MAIVSAGKTWAGGARHGLDAHKRMILIAVWLALQTLDAVTTAFGLRAGLSEGNGLAASLMARYGEFGAYGLKALVTLVVLGCILLLQRRYARVWLGLKIVSVYMSFVVALNIVSLMLQG